MENEIIIKKYRFSDGTIVEASCKEEAIKQHKVTAAKEKIPYKEESKKLADKLKNKGFKVFVDEYFDDRGTGKASYYHAYYVRTQKKCSAANVTTDICFSPIGGPKIEVEYNAEFFKKGMLDYHRILLNSEKEVIDYVTKVYKVLDDLNSAYISMTDLIKDFNHAIKNK